MKCIIFQPLPSPLHSEQIYRHNIWQYNRPRTMHVHRKGFSFVSRTRTRALPDPVFLAATLPTTGKLSVLLQTSAVCLFAYWVANFVVPEIVLKDLRSNNTDDDGENPAEDKQ